MQDEWEMANAELPRRLLELVVSDFWSQVEGATRNSRQPRECKRSSKPELNGSTLQERSMSAPVQTSLPQILLRFWRQHKAYPRSLLQGEGLHPSVGHREL